MEQVQVKEQVEISVDNEKDYQLVVRNDDFNTFEHVITCLISICKIDETTAIQATLHIHHKGEAVIVEGVKSEMDIMADGLTMMGIDAIVRKKSE